jgi:hypothetical protein
MSLLHSYPLESDLLDHIGTQHFTPYTGCHAPFATGDIRSLKNQKYLAQDIRGMSEGVPTSKSFHQANVTESLVNFTITFTFCRLSGDLSYLIRWVDSNHGIKNDVGGLYFDGGAGSQLAVAASEMTLGLWDTVSFVSNNGSGFGGDVYLNGIFLRRLTTWFEIANSGVINLMAYSAAGNNFIGFVKDIQIDNALLNASQCAALAAPYGAQQPKWVTSCKGDDFGGAIGFGSTVYSDHSSYLDFVIDGSDTVSRIMFDGDTCQGGRFFTIPDYIDDIFVEYEVKYPTGFDVNFNFGRSVGLITMYDAWGGNYTERLEGKQNTIGQNPIYQDALTWFDSAHNYTIIGLAATEITKNVWHKIKQHIKKSTGLIDTWIDGILVNHSIGLAITNVIPRLCLMGLWQGIHPQNAGNYFLMKNMRIGEIDTVIPVPNDPTNLAESVVSKNEIDLSWTDNSGDEIGFKIERALGAGSFSQVGMVLFDVTNYHDTGLLPDTTYRYRVCAYNLGGDSGYTNIVTAKTLPDVQPSSFGGGPGGGFGRITQIQRPLRRLF